MNLLGNKGERDRDEEDDGAVNVTGMKKMTVII